MPDFRGVTSPLELFSLNSTSTGMTLEEIGKQLGRSKDEIEQYLKQYKILYAFEHNLDELMKKL